VNIGLFVGARESGYSLEEAMTFTFISLVLIQFFKAYNFRSDRLSVLNKPFANRWLNLAIVGELLLLPLLIYVPFLSDAFGTTAPSMQEWGLLVALAATVVPVLEMVKWMARREWFGPLS
jgi:Ca2+-transporting ATPase